MIRCIGQILPTSIAIDLEFFIEADAKKLLQQFSKIRPKESVFLTASSLQLHEIPKEFQVVHLFTRNKERYLKEVCKRSKLFPGKAGQKEDILYDGFESLPDEEFYITLDPWHQAPSCDLCFTAKVLKQLEIQVPSLPASNRCSRC